LLIPQINFIATVLTPDDNCLRLMSDQLENFVIKGLNIAKCRLYLAPEEGGLGLFNLKNFICALQTTWVKRAVQSINDNWKVTLMELGEGDATNCNRNIEQTDCGEGLRNILFSYNIFKTAYSTSNGNYIFDTVFKNDRYGTGRHQATKFDEEFFGPNIMFNSAREVEELTWNRMMVAGEFVKTCLPSLNKKIRSAGRGISAGGKFL